MVSRATSWVMLQLLWFIIGFSTGSVGPPGSYQCLGITCGGACNAIACGQTCSYTSLCNLYCPNGDCLACCSCVKEEDVGVGNVVAAKFDNSLYIINRTHIHLEDFSDMELLHTTLAKVNQTWWQVHDNGTYYEPSHECETGPGCFACQVHCEL
jgi:hypothetical protein